MQPRNKTEEQLSKLQDQEGDHQEKSRKLTQELKQKTLNKLTQELKQTQKLEQEKLKYLIRRQTMQPMKQWNK